MLGAPKGRCNKGYAAEHVVSSFRIATGEVHVHLTSFCRFSTVPGFGRSSDCLHAWRRL